MSCLHSISACHCCMDRSLLGLHATVHPTWRRDRCGTSTVKRVIGREFKIFFRGRELSSCSQTWRRAAQTRAARRRGGEQARLVQPGVVAASKKGSCSRCLGAVGGPESFETCRRRQYLRHAGGESRKGLRDEGEGWGDGVMGYVRTLLGLTVWCWSRVQPAMPDPSTPKPVRAGENAAEKDGSSESESKEKPGEERSRDKAREKSSSQDKSGSEEKSSSQDKSGSEEKSTENSPDYGKAKTPSPSRGRSRSRRSRREKRSKKEKKDKKDKKDKKEKKETKDISSEQEDDRKDKGQWSEEDSKEWGPYHEVAAFRICDLPTAKSAVQLPSGYWNEPVCWAWKPRSTMHMHLLQNSACQIWQQRLAGKGTPKPQFPCRFCTRRFYKKADCEQHEYRCSAGPPAEPATSPPGKGQPSQSETRQGKKAPRPTPRPKDKSWSEVSRRGSQHCSPERKSSGGSRRGRKEQAGQGGGGTGGIFIRSRERARRQDDDRRGLSVQSVASSRRASVRIRPRDRRSRSDSRRDRAPAPTTDGRRRSRTPRWKPSTGF